MTRIPEGTAGACPAPFREAPAERNGAKQNAASFTAAFCTYHSHGSAPPNRAGVKMPLGQVRLNEAACASYRSWRLPGIRFPHTRSAQAGVWTREEANCRGRP